MAVDKLREIIVAGLEQTFPAKKGLETLVFGKTTETTYDNETIQIDIFDGKRGAAKYTARGAKGQTVGLEGWDTVSVTPPVIDENFVVTAQDLKVRDYGKGNINAPAGQKFQNIVNKQLVRLKDRKQRTYNNQIVELITSGKVTIIEYDDKGVAKASREEDFLMPATHIFTVATAWNNSGDIFGDMRTADNLIAKDSGLTTTDAVVGETTIADMMADAKIQALLDNRRINFGEIAMEADFAVERHDHYLVVGPQLLDEGEGGVGQHVGNIAPGLDRHAIVLEVRVEVVVPVAGAEAQKLLEALTVRVIRVVGPVVPLAEASGGVARLREHLRKGLVVLMYLETPVIARRVNERVCAGQNAGM